MRYWNLVIWSLDQYKLNELSDLYDVDYYEADIYIDDNTDSASITNQLFYYVLSEAVYKLDIEEDSKQILIDSIYCNCLDSWYNLPDDRDIFIEKDRETIDNFLNQ